jgi:hypothetical protein
MSRICIAKILQKRQLHTRQGCHQVDVGLEVSQFAYGNRVAGIISGAGSLKPSGSLRFPMTFRNILVAMFAAAGTLGIYSEPAVAQQCDLTGGGVPGITNVAATNSTIDVSWVLLCPLIPSRMELRQGGTSQRDFQDGLLSESPLLRHS